MLIADSLQSLFQEINQARDEQDLRSRVIISLGKHFAAKRCGLFFFDQFPQTNSNSNLPKLALSLEHNPVLRYVVERHAVIHEASLLPPGVWEKLCSRTDHAHVMAGPIVSNGQLVGGLGFTRTRHQPTFNDQNLADLSALCLHVSTWLAIMRSPPIKFNPLNIDRLTPREIQIAQLVARGLTNAQIGSNLWITENSVKQALKRIFRKLEVSSRAEMVARLSLDTSFST